MDGARPARLSAKDGCWRFTGEDVAVIWWVNEGFYKFFNWCVPYVDLKMEMTTIASGWNSRRTTQTRIAKSGISRCRSICTTESLGVSTFVVRILTGISTLSMTAV